MNEITIDTNNWSVIKDTILGVEPSHIEMIYFDEENQNWRLDSTYFQGITYGYRINKVSPNHYIILDAWRSEYDLDNQDIDCIPESDIDWIKENGLKET